MTERFRSGCIDSDPFIKHEGIPLTSTRHDQSQYPLHRGSVTWEVVSSEHNPPRVTGFRGTAASLPGRLKQLFCNCTRAPIEDQSSQRVQCRSYAAGPQPAPHGPPAKATLNSLDTKISTASTQHGPPTKDRLSSLDTRISVASTQSRHTSKEDDLRSHYNNSGINFSASSRLGQCAHFSLEKYSPNDFSWMFVFRLPSDVDGTEQANFEKNLKWRGFWMDNCTATEVLATAVLDVGFQFAGHKVVRDAMRAEFPFDTKAREREGLCQPLLDFGRGRGDLTSYSKAQHCTIEFFFHYFDDLNKSLTKSLSKSNMIEEAKIERAVSSSTSQSTDGKKSKVKILHFVSYDRKKLHVCVRMESDLAEVFADHLEYPVQLSKSGLRYLGLRNSQNFSNVINDRSTTLAYVKYDEKHREQFRLHPDQFNPEFKTVLRPIDNIRLLYDWITDSINIHILDGVGLVDASFPLHNMNALQDLRRKWVWKLWDPSAQLEQVRDYFGEEVAFYFLFLQTLSIAVMFLLLPSLVAIFYLRLHQSSDASNVTETVECLFAAILLIWYRFFTKYWQRREAEYANKWGIGAHAGSGIKKLMNQRFRGDYREFENHVDTCTRSFRGESGAEDADDGVEGGGTDGGTEEQTSAQEEHVRTEWFRDTWGRELHQELHLDEAAHMPYVSDFWRHAGIVLSALLSIGFVVVFIFFVLCELSCLVTLHALYIDYPHSVSMFLSGLAGMQIMIVDATWGKACNWITDLECRDSLSQFLWSKSLKTCVVRWINTMVTLFYFAFEMPRLDDKICVAFQYADNECHRYFRQLLRYQLLGILTTRFIGFHIFKNVVKPYVDLWRKLPASVSFGERQAAMSKYTGSDIADDYLDILLPLSFVLLFGMATPSASLLLLLVIIVQRCSSACKLTWLLQRPYPHMAEDIRFYNPMMAFFGYAMIGSNLLLMLINFPHVLFFQAQYVFAAELSTESPKIQFVTSALVFFVHATVLILLWRFFDFIIPGVSDFLANERKRQDKQRHLLYYESGDLENMRFSNSQRKDSLKDRVDYAKLKTLETLQKLARTSFNDPN